MSAKGKAAKKQAKAEAHAMRTSAARLANDAETQIQDYSDQSNQALASIVAAYGAAGSLEKAPTTTGYETGVDTNPTVDAGTESAIRNIQSAEYEGKEPYKEWRKDTVKQRELLNQVQMSSPVSGPEQMSLLSGSAGQGLSRTRDLLERDRKKMIKNTQAQIVDAYRGAAHAEDMGDLMARAANLDLVTSIVSQIASFGISTL